MKYVGTDYNLNPVRPIAWDRILIYTSLILFWFLLINYYISKQSNNSQDEFIQQHTTER